MLPNKTKIGLIGGGQLGKMLIEAAQPWNTHFHILEQSNAPAANVANEYSIGDITNSIDIIELSDKTDVLTYEIEHINVEALIELEKQGKRIVPSPVLLEIIQDKGLQKLFYEHHQIPTLDFELVNNQTEWNEKLLQLKGDKFVAKLRKGGYDGKGVQILNKREILDNYNLIPFSEPSVLEQFLPGCIELSVMVARNGKGEIKTYPTVEMEFNPTSNLVEYLFAPADISNEINEKAQRVAMDAIIKLKGEGVFAVEMFLEKSSGNMYVNEIAPRPHNSGHHTIEACYTSQYEQLNRILLELPLGNTDLIQPAAMLNIIGPDGVNGEYRLKHTDKILGIPGVYIHLYNKKESKPNRKMGHITVMAPTIEEVKQKAMIVKNLMEIEGV